jgi:hypothetical protein
MNKLLIFPLAVMFLLTIFSVIYTGEQYVGSSPDLNNNSGIIIQNETGTVDVPGADPMEFNIWETTGALVILAAAIAVGIVAGFKILGSGFNEFSQSLMFNAILFLGLWAVLTIVSADLMFDTAMITLLWVGLTMTYIIGMGVHLANSSGG